MKLKVYAVRDIATDQYGTPMFLVTRAQAIRSFADEVNREDKENLLNRHPKDYELAELGEYDTTTGLITAKPPEQIITASECKTKA
jgi:hypothetical protein